MQENIERKLMEASVPKAAKISGNVKHVLIVMSGKGGVGKSTIAVNLAAALAAEGKKVGVLDSDFHGPTIPKLLGLAGRLEQAPDGKMIPIKVNPNLKAVSVAFLSEDPDKPFAWRGPIKMAAVNEFLTKTQWGDLDYLIIDLPPGTGEEPLTIAQLIPNADGAIIVTTPQDVALISVRKSISFARLVGLHVIGVIENMSGMACPHCKKDIEIFRSGGAETAAKELGIDFLGRIPMDPRIAQSGEQGKPFVLEERELIRIFGLIVERITRKVEN